MTKKKNPIEQSLKTFLQPPERKWLSVKDTKWAEYNRDALVRNSIENSDSFQTRNDFHPEYPGTSADDGFGLANAMSKTAEQSAKWKSDHKI